MTMTATKKAITAIPTAILCVAMGYADSPEPPPDCGNGKGYGEYDCNRPAKCAWLNAA
jgi:hypothetical protein